MSVLNFCTNFWERDKIDKLSQISQHFKIKTKKAQVLKRAIKLIHLLVHIRTYTLVNFCVHLNLFLTYN